MFTTNQLRLLAALAAPPRDEFSMSELGRVVGKRPGVIQRGLNALERQGYVSSRRRANLRLFKLNTAHPLIEEIGSIALATAPGAGPAFKGSRPRNAMRAHEAPGRYESAARKILILAGPNGAGKTTFAGEYLPNEAA
jgi:DNA-binding transcriptional ArsR family regulator